MIAENFIKLYEKSFRENWELKCLTDYGETDTFTYGEVAQEIARIHLIFKHCQLRRGDKVAIIGKNNTRWCIAFLATITYGAIVVPILQDFNPSDVHYIINHSESSFLFTSDLIWERLEEDKLTDIRGVFSLTDFRCLYQRDGESIQYFLRHLDEQMEATYPQGFRREDVIYTDLDNDKVMLINYTSGSTGNSKGVMVPFRTVWSNIAFADEKLGLKECCSVLSLLPMAHMYGFAFEFIYELCMGGHIHFLTKAPSPSVLAKALSDVKPDILICVPLIVEKIVQSRIFPKLKTLGTQSLLALPFTKGLVYKKIRQRLTDFFGGNFYEVIVGGAAFNQEVEGFLHDIKFPYTVGYGMTECGPIICYQDYHTFKQGSCGKVVPRMELKINSQDPQNVEGEIMVRGMNVMLGYYKNEEATHEAIDPDGWLHTGDLGTIDKDGNVFIRGRQKNMLLGANGQNIYPEEIEEKFISHALIDECVVVQRDQKLYGLVYTSDDTLKTHGMTREDFNSQLDRYLKHVNTMLPSFYKVSKLEARDTEFEKTPKRNIKRFLYT